MIMKKLSLDDYVKAERKKVCPVCKLPPGVKKEMAGRKSGVNLAMVGQWLRALGHRVTERQLAGHFRHGHGR